MNELGVGLLPRNMEMRDELGHYQGKSIGSTLTISIVHCGTVCAIKIYAVVLYDLILMVAENFL